MAAPFRRNDRTRRRSPTWRDVRCSDSLRRIGAPAEFANGCCSCCVSPSLAMARIKRLDWPWRTKSMRWGSGGGRQRRLSFAVPAVKWAKRSSRAIIQREQPFSRNISHASRILDCAERFRPRSSSTENRARRPARTKANILGQACELAARRWRYRNLINIESRRETLMQAPHLATGRLSALHFNSSDLVDRHLARDAAQCYAPERRLYPAVLQQGRRLRVLDHRFRHHDRARGCEALDARGDIDGLAEIVLLVVKRDREA